jgi:transposase
METVLDTKPKEHLSTKEVAEMLGVTEQTIYNYVKSGEIKPANEDWSIDGTYYFFSDDVEKLRVRFQKPGLSTKEVSEQIGVTINTVAKYIKQGKLKAIKQEYRGKERYFVTENDLADFIENDFSHRSKRQVLFMPDMKYHLYQLFVQQDKNEYGRLLDIEGRQHGIVVTEKGERIPVTQLADKGYAPVRTIEKAAPSTKKGYAVFEIPRPHHIKSNLYKIFDMLFVEAGAQNLKITGNGDNIKVEVKPFLIEKRMVEKYPEEIDALNRYLTVGKIQKRPGGLLINSNVKSVQAYIDERVKKELLEIAAKQEITLEELVGEIVKEGIVRYRSEAERKLSGE